MSTDETKSLPLGRKNNQMQTRGVGNDAVIGRLAPSPTGNLHLGHALSFLAAYWSCRSQNGRLILRFEDVDTDRAGREHIASAIEDLRWLGIGWDADPIIQSTRIDELTKAAHMLLERDLAYPCVCTRKDLRDASLVEEQPGAPHGAEIRYPGTCRGRFSTLSKAEAQTSREAGLRFLTPDEDVTFTDAVYGNVRTNVAQTVGDFLILRRNKIPAYQLAIVVDDAHDGVTEVVRGRDLLASTARQILIMRGLGFVPPRHAHVPLVCDAAGNRLAKRDHARSLSDLRRGGVSAERIQIWAARRLGQSADARELTRRFLWDLVPRHDIVLPPALTEEL